jgi:hypothetical protein
MPFIKEGVINIFLERLEFTSGRRKKERRESKIFIQTIVLQYEGEGEEGSNP